MVPLYCVKRYSKKKNWIPASSTPNEVDRESVQKRVWVSEWVVTSSQESRNPSSLDNCCFSSGEEFSSTRNKQIEVGKLFSNLTSGEVSKRNHFSLEIFS